MKSIRVLAPAKINLLLRVLGRRHDGYHELETIFQAITLFDELIVEETTGGARIEVTGFPGLEDEQNLVMRSLRVLERLTGRSLPVRIRLVKRIPVAAGLGGGSSDAAATLLAVTSLFGLGLSPDDLKAAAVGLGADVPFFLVGGSAVGEGIGEHLTPVALPTDYGLVLINPGFPVSTARVFNEFSRTLTGTFRDGRVWSLLRERRSVEDLLHNDLQEVTEGLHPEIRRLREELEALGARRALMSGSGPTVFGLVDQEIGDRAMSECFHGKTVIAARPWSGSILID